MDDSFVKAPISVPKLSGFDKSHQNLFTGKVGTLIPAMVDELIPGSKVHLKMALSASLPPLASETFMRCSIKAEAFFVPMRLLSGSFESWFTDNPKRYYDGAVNMDLKGALPYARSTRSAQNASSIPWVTRLTGVGSLADYLGCRSVTPIEFCSSGAGISLMPFLAYHRIYNDWYRNTLVQKDVFLPEIEGVTSNAQDASSSVAGLPWLFLDVDATGNNPQRSLDNDTWHLLADSVSLFDLRQRNFGLDYFTTATPEPQQGSPATVSLGSNGDSDGTFSIATLRAANSLQQFKERNNLLGNYYVDQLRGRYGVRPSDAIAQRTMYLGRGEFEVYSKGIYQTANNTDSGDTEIDTIHGPNPFGSVGARYGAAYASGDNFVVNFEATEPGYLFVLVSLVPRVTYSSGIDRMLTRYIEDGSLVEMANPILQNIGPEPIYSRELSLAGYGHIFGYTDRYASFKTKQDSLHGLLRDGLSLESFALQRSLVGNQEISDNFLQIPKNYLDQVSATTSAISVYGYWCDTYFDYKVAMPIAKYSLPSLQDPAYEHGKTIIVDRGGSKIS